MFEVIDGQYALDGVKLEALTKQYGTPLFVYSQERILKNIERYKKAFEGMDVHFCYAVKANNNLSILQTIYDAGFGFDIVSGGEYLRVKEAGAKDAMVIFSGVGKTDDEIETALRCGVYCFNIESHFELEQLIRVGQYLKMKVPISVRVNPDVDPKTHPYISTGLKGAKFGVNYEEAMDLYKRAHKSDIINVIGVDAHIGSQIMDVEPFLESADRLLELVDALEKEGIKPKHVDLGGGVGICYENEEEFDYTRYAQELKKRFENRGLSIIFEPGRSIIGDTGYLLTRVIGVKNQSGKNYVVVDAAMNDLIRPTLYEAYHEVGNSEVRVDEKMTADIVGPVCESGDFLAQDREIYAKEGDILYIACAGAYGMTMSSNYNVRNKAAEVMVQNSKSRLIRKRDTYEQQWQNEIAYIRM